MGAMDTWRFLTKINQFSVKAPDLTKHVKIKVKSVLERHKSQFCKRKSVTIAIRDKGANSSRKTFWPQKCFPKYFY